MPTPDQLLPTATRIADALLEVQQRVNEQVDAAHAELLPAVQAALGVAPGAAVDPGDLVDAGSPARAPSSPRPPSRPWSR